MNTLPAQRTSFEVMETKIDVTMDDVVSAFVAQYESNNYKAKQQLSKDIRLLERSIEDLDAEVLKTVTAKEYEKKNIPPFGLKSELTGSLIHWANKKERNRAVVTFEIKITMKDTPKGDNSRRYGAYQYRNEIGFKIDKKIPAKLVNKFWGIEKQLWATRAKLATVLENIKAISRKERQVRGRIALKKLEDSGYSSLMQDDELLKLVQLD